MTLVLPIFPKNKKEEQKDEQAHSIAVCSDTDRRTDDGWLPACGSADGNASADQSP